MSRPVATSAARIGIAVGARAPHPDATSHDRSTSPRSGPQSDPKASGLKARLQASRLQPSSRTDGSVPASGKTHAVQPARPYVAVRARFGLPAFPAAAKRREHMHAMPRRRRPRSNARRPAILQIYVTGSCNR
ncbi:hypothetical protein X946_5407 [Burkholderia sp. ABCPW 111]|nr:hypothetical protein X946_5407 [Burkholderia sp. ABCPW 111]